MPITASELRREAGATLLTADRTVLEHLPQARWSC